MTQDEQKWSQLRKLLQEESSYTLANIVDFLLDWNPSDLEDRVIPYIQEHTKHWPSPYFNHWKQQEKATLFLKIINKIDDLSVFAYEHLSWMISYARKRPVPGGFLRFHSEGEFLEWKNWDYYLDSYYIHNLHTLRIDSSFEGNSLRSVTGKKDFNKLKQFAVEVYGYEPYCSRFGDAFVRKVKKPNMEVLSFRGYPLWPKGVESMAKAEMPAMRLLHFSLMACGGLHKFLESSLYQGLETLSVVLYQSADAHGEDYATYRRKNFPHVPDGFESWATLDLKAIAESPNSKNLQHLFFHEEHTSFRFEDLEPLLSSQNFPNLETLCIPLQEDRRKQAAEAFSKTSNFPALKRCIFDSFPTDLDHLLELVGMDEHMRKDRGMELIKSY